MGHSPGGGLRVAVVHNTDFHTDVTDDPSQAARADVALAAGDVARALAARGWQPVLVPLPDDATALAALVRWLAAEPPALVFNLCESLAGDARHEALLPALLDHAGIAYTGSGPLALGLALRKDVARRLLAAAGVPIPAGAVVAEGAPLPTALAFPLIVKPAREDASVGIDAGAVVHDPAALAARVAYLHAAYRQPVIVERYIEGRELYVSLLGNGDGVAALPMHEIDFEALPDGLPRIVSYAGKWDPSSPEYHGTRSVRCRPLPDATRRRCEEVARAAFAALELRDYARVDLRLADDGTPYVIDVNPNCDLSDGAGVSRAASFAGLDYAALIDRIAEIARARHPGLSKALHAPLDAAAPRHLHRTDDPTAAPERSAVAGAAGGDGRAVHAGGGLGRARAD